MRFYPCGYRGWGSFFHVCVAVAAISCGSSSRVLAAEAGDGRSFGRPWDLSLRAFTEFDDNVPLKPDVDPTFPSAPRALGVGVYGNGAYRFYQDDDWTVGAG